MIMSMEDKELFGFFGKISAENYPSQPAGFSNESLIVYLAKRFCDEFDYENYTMIEDQLKNWIFDNRATIIDTGYIGDYGTSSVVDDMIKQGLSSDVILQLFYIFHILLLSFFLR